MGETSCGLCSHQLTGSFAKGCLEITCEFCKTDNHRAKLSVSLSSTIKRESRRKWSVFAALDLVFEVVCPCLMLLQSIPCI